MKRQFLPFLLALLPVAASAQDAVEIDGIYYNVITKGKVAEVTKKPSGYYTGSVDIPASVIYKGVEYSVTSIGNAAFYFSSGLETVTIPDGVTSMGSSAFQGCTSLASVTLPGSMTRIGTGAFADCTSLTSMSIPGSVTSIGQDAFRNCTALTSVTMESGVTSIGLGAFRNCSALASLTIPGSVQSIGDWAFHNCSSLTSMSIPSSVESIGQTAFGSCVGLTSVHIADLAAWCNVSFGDFFSNPLAYAHHLYLGENEIKDLVIPGSVTSVGGYAFASCSGLTSVTIPGSVTSIGQAAFAGCSGLTSVTIPSSVTSIGDWAFASKSLMTVKSYIEQPFSVTSPFGAETYSQGKLIVPRGTKELYARCDGWKEFLTIEEMPAPNGVCATPTISFLGDKFKFQCATPGAEFTCSLTSEEHFTGDEVSIGNGEVTYTLTVYATAPDYDPSPAVTYSLTLNRNDVNKDGRVDVADVSAILTKMAGR